ncbi:MAG: hypothetical protein CMQ05_03755 [Gammaproteobacteria bacterium]|nr:hypothetical protein [Gammaproteobacteria bacterium]
MIEGVNMMKCLCKKLLARSYIGLCVLGLFAGCTSADVFDQIQHNLQQDCERELGEPLCHGEHDLHFADCERKFGTDLCKRPFSLTWEEYSAERNALKETGPLGEATSAAAPDTP